MATPTPKGILEIFEDLNFPSATKLRAALLKKGFKARNKDVEQFVKSHTPTQRFAKAPTYHGNFIASRPKRKVVLDSIDLPQNQVATSRLYCCYRTCPAEKLWATAQEEKTMASVIQELRDLLADTGKPAEVNAYGEFDTKTLNRCVAQQGIAVRFKEGRQDLAT